MLHRILLLLSFKHSESRLIGIFWMLKAETLTMFLKEQLSQSGLCVGLDCLVCAPPTINWKLAVRGLESSETTELGLDVIVLLGIVVGRQFSYHVVFFREKNLNLLSFFFRLVLTYAKLTNT